jgi:hypothetical protein
MQTIWKSDKMQFSPKFYICRPIQILFLLLQKKYLEHFLIQYIKLTLYVLVPTAKFKSKPFSPSQKMLLYTQNLKKKIKEFKTLIFIFEKEKSNINRIPKIFVITLN